MPNYPDTALKESTHTDDFGYLYRVMGEEPRAFCVDYWDLRLNRWCQDMGTSFPYLIKTENNPK